MINLSQEEILRLTALGRVYGVNWRTALTMAIELATEEESEAIEEEAARVRTLKKEKWEALKAKGRAQGAGVRRGRSARDRRVDHPADAPSLTGPASRRGRRRKAERAAANAGAPKAELRGAAKAAVAKAEAAKAEAAETEAADAATAETE